MTTTMLPPIVEDALGIRRFDDAYLQSQIDKVTAALPAGRQAAAIDVGVDKNGIIVAGAVKIGEQWSVMGAFEKCHSGEWSGKVGARWSR